MTEYPQPTPTAQADSMLKAAGGANWQDISTAPKDGTRFVAVGNNYGLYSEGQHTCIVQWFRGCWMDVSEWNETSELKYLTHWMPLLPLPGNAARAPADSVLEDAAQQPRLKVRLTAFPESNGKQNWTALLVRADKWDGLVGNCGGISLAREELWNRVAYAAECARFLIGERDTEPFILDYGDDIQTPEEWKGEVYGGRKPRGAARKQGANHD